MLLIFGKDEEEPLRRFGHSSSPSGYGDISSHLPWIANTSRTNFCPIGFEFDWRAQLQQRNVMLETSVLKNIIPLLIVPASPADAGHLERKSTRFNIRPHPAMVTSPVTSPGSQTQAGPTSVQLALNSTGVLNFKSAMSFVDTATPAGCGLQLDFNRNIRIVGGEEAGVGAFPYLVSITARSLLGRRRHICGGSLISKDLVLTAAHCIDGKNKKGRFEVVVGEHDLEKDEPWSEIKEVKEIIVHPDYNKDTFQHDIGLLRLKTAVDFGQNRTEIGVACLCKPGNVTGDVITAGWGRLEEGGSSPNVVQSVSIPIVDREVCNELLKEEDENYKVYETQICAGEEGRDSCQGDSGGPLIKTHGGLDYVCGIVSWGVGCARKDLPGRGETPMRWDEREVRIQIRSAPFSNLGTRETSLFHQEFYCRSSKDSSVSSFHREGRVSTGMIRSLLAKDSNDAIRLRGR
ncbi:unnamed protein product [Cyprideis torosa]|uniref:limulus clotting factor C n=1 Tax=Cyprideis torosa TaxID=163714 RepID=A0A7R8ZL61_9CRUS|nr:unnamed protein product [Cyprideis torosa]CAG0892631.1 unnamed protein product [Cyprideis torosa]